MIDIESQYTKVLPSFFQRSDVVEIARDLLGKVLFTYLNGELTGGMIVETEAYCGETDRACHAFGKRTARTEPMYQPGGIAYVYLCYGIHHLFNVVTNKLGAADAVLIRALEPVVGLDIMLKRRQNKNAKLASGPGVLSQALGISTSLNGCSLQGDEIWIASEKEAKLPEIVAGKRIGVEYAGVDAHLPWRFGIKNHPEVSKKMS